MSCMPSIVDPEVSAYHDVSTSHGDVLAAFRRGPIDQYPRDARLRREDVPLLSAVKLGWGPEVSLINISSTGMLVETTSKFAPGSATEFQLCGPDTSLVVPARFVRSEVSAVDARSVRYHAAVVFATELHLPKFVRAGVPATPRALADLLAHVLADLEHRKGSSSLRSKFEHGLRQLVPAHDIRLRDGAGMPQQADHSIYFTVPSASGSGAILQATFEPGYDLAETEFRILKSAATLAAVVLEFERMS